MMMDASGRQDMDFFIFLSQGIRQHLENSADSPYFKINPKHACSYILIWLFQSAISASNRAASRIKPIMQNFAFSFFPAAS